MRSKLNILFVGKYPPIEGGESSKLYWLARGLGERGHKVYIVSNCQEVEEEYRCVLNSNDLDELQPYNVNLFSTNPFDTLSFIPYYNPFSEKLTSLGIEVCDSYDIDVVIGWYLLPYSVAAYNIAKIKNKKFILQHAGSDIRRLLTNQFLYSYLKEIILGADAIMSYPGMKVLFDSLGLRNIYVHVPKIHPGYFNINKSNSSVKKEIKMFNNIKKDDSFLFLGKLSKRKGLEYLLEAFQEISDQHLLIFGGGKEENYFKEKYKKQNIHYHNPVPPWSVPDLIRSCNAVVIPEYNFGIKQHTSRIPLETLMCGKVPIVSSQISQKYGKLEKFFIKADPSNVHSFRSIIQNEELIKEKEEVIRENYLEIQKEIGDYDNSLKSFENFLFEFCS